MKLNLTIIGKCKCQLFKQNLTIGYVVTFDILDYPGMAQFGLIKLTNFPHYLETSRGVLVCQNKTVFEKRFYFGNT